MLAVPRRKITLYKGMLGDAVFSLIKRKAKPDDEVRLFNKEFADYMGVRFGLSVSSGTAALALILDALGLCQGDEVILTAYTFPSVPSCIREKGFLLRFVDIDRGTDNMDIEAIKKAVTDRTKVIIATHLFGRPCPIDEIIALARQKDIYVIEDCAHAIGASYKGKKVGGFGDAAYCSFSLTKPFNVFNGGMILTNDDGLYQRISVKVSGLPDLPMDHIIKNIFSACFLYVMTSPIIFSFTLYPLLLLLSFFKKDLIDSYNRIFKKIIFYGSSQYRFSTVQAVCGRKMLAFFDDMIKDRREKVRLFEQLLLQAGIRNDQHTGQADEEAFPYFYVMKHPQRQDIARKMLWHGVDTGKFIMSNCGAMFDPQHSYLNAQRAYEQSIQIPVEFCSEKHMRKIIFILTQYTDRADAEKRRHDEEKSCLA